MPLPVRVRHAPLHDRPVSRQEALGRGTHELEAALEAQLVNIVEEQAANAARFVTMLQEEVFVTPLLVAGIEFLAKRVAGRFCDRVPVHNVIVERVLGRQVEAATEPPYGFALAGCKKAEVRMRGRHVRVVGMQDKRHADGLERLARKFRAVLRG